MRSVRWWRLLSLLVLTVVWWGCGSAEAHQIMHEDCQEKQLHGTVDATIRFRQHGRNFVEVSSDMTVEVPVREWSMANQLTFSENSAGYRKAMHCLLRGPDNELRKTEWRPSDPVATSNGDRVQVFYRSITWIRAHQDYRLGPWEIKRPRNNGTKWEVYLRPTTLRNSRWSVEAELGDLDFEHYGQTSFVDRTTVTWTTKTPGGICPGKCIEVDLPWHRSFPLMWDQSIWKPAGIATWWVFASGVLALAARRARRPYGSPSVATPGPVRRIGMFGGEQGLAQPVLQWALLSVAVALTLLLFLHSPEPDNPGPQMLVCIAVGLTLILVARPWHRPATPRTQEPDDSAGRRRRQAYTVIGFATVVAAAGILVILDHGLFDLPAHLVFPKPEAPDALGTAGYVLAGLATVWLWLAAVSAWAWRFAREGGLVPAAWSRRWDERPVLCVTAVAALLALIAGGLLWSLLWATGNQWKRATWLIDGNSPAARGNYVGKNLANFSSTELTWIFAYSWFLAGIALLALLKLHFTAQRARVSSEMDYIPFGPDKPDLLLLAALFSLTVGMRGAKFASNNAQYGIWFVLNILSLFAVLAAGRRWSVLSRTGYLFHMHRPGANNRGELMEKVHQYRNLNHQLKLADQGRAGGVTYEELEEQLRGLRRWLVERCLKKSPPCSISILDVALAWGPETHWWHNARQGARLAFCFGIPASFILIYVESHDRYNGQQLPFEPTAVPNLVAGLITFQTAWAGAGFVLGALWRLLPGRHSTVRAWSLTFAYVMPAALAALFTRFVDSNPAMLLLYSLVMLFILTLTGLWMDTWTLKEERQYWPSRFALLVSIHRLRGMSGTVAYLLAQLVAVVAILKGFITIP
ncbi:DUF6185 family protein [Streptomyces humi]|uniref:DUF6185 family protein n=1 Tax=Streptomyces humi TaxID=1428620 RepID=UPI0006287D9E|nr:DUF6185 family protein [Streptomyces humi]